MVVERQRVVHVWMMACEVAKGGVDGGVLLDVPDSGWDTG
ncbi:MAG: hypothetical protein RL026_2711 [Pseudomonadota bacterium]